MAKFNIRGEPTCQKCLKTFHNVTSLWEHLYEHANIYACMICQKSFRTKEYLIIHKANHNMFTNLNACSICNRIFDVQWKLVRHKRVHDNAKLKCNICDISFKYVKVYNDHVLLHMKK